MTVEQRPAHPTATLNDVVHQRARLGILTVLGEAQRVDFPYLRSLLQLTDGNLGRHIEVLAADGLVEVTKGYEGRRPRTWVEITKLGRGALAAEMAALKQLVQRYEQPPTRPPKG
jgi:DNA-binding MarR family transcriptional regulator